MRPEAFAGETTMMERSSRVLGMRMPIDEYETLRLRALAEHKTVGGLALELMRAGNNGSANTGRGGPRIAR